MGKKGSKSRKKSRGGIKLKDKFRNKSQKAKKVKNISDLKETNQDLRNPTKKSKKKVARFVHSFLDQLNKNSNPNQAHTCCRKANNHTRNKKKANIIQSTAESQERNKIKKEVPELDEMPIFESDSTYLDKEIKKEIVPQSIVDFRYVENEIKREESTLDDMPNFEMDSTYLDKTIKKEIKIEPLV